MRRVIRGTLTLPFLPRREFTHLSCRRFPEYFSNVYRNPFTRLFHCIFNFAVHTVRTLFLLYLFPKRLKFYLSRMLIVRRIIDIFEIRTFGNNYFFFFWNFLIGGKRSGRSYRVVL